MGNEPDYAAVAECEYEYRYDDSPGQVLRQTSKATRTSLEIRTVCNILTNTTSSPPSARDRTKVHYNSGLSWSSTSVTGHRADGSGFKPCAARQRPSGSDVELPCFVPTGHGRKTRPFVHALFVSRPVGGKNDEENIIVQVLFIYSMSMICPRADRGLSADPAAQRQKNALLWISANSRSDR